MVVCHQACGPQACGPPPWWSWSYSQHFCDMMMMKSTSRRTSYVATNLPNFSFVTTSNKYNAYDGAERVSIVDLLTRNLIQQRLLGVANHHIITHISSIRGVVWPSFNQSLRANWDTVGRRLTSLHMIEDRKDCIPWDLPGGNLNLPLSLHNHYSASPMHANISGSVSPLKGTLK